MSGDGQSISIKVFLLQLYRYVRKEYGVQINRGKQIVRYTSEMLQNAGVFRDQTVSSDRLAWAVFVHTRLNDALSTPIAWMCLVRDYTRGIVGEARFQRWNRPYVPAMNQPQVRLAVPQSQPIHTSRDAHRSPQRKHVPARTRAR